VLIQPGTSVNSHAKARQCFNGRTVWSPWWSSDTTQWLSTALFWCLPNWTSATL